MSRARNRTEWYYPVEKGKVLVYRYMSPELPGRRRQTRLEREILRVERTGKTYKLVWAVRFPELPPEWSHKFRARRSPKGVFSDEEWIIRSPVRKGRKWKSENYAAGFRIMSVKARVKVPAGVFRDCLHVSYYDDDIGGGDIYFAGGIGVVRKSQWGEGDPHDYELVKVGA